LLVDEVLSVGDSYFQEKCLVRMNKFVNEGTTILLVSHDMRTVRSFCKTVLWLENGLVKMIGSADQVVDAYLADQG
jgi:ABC-type polysaccharide/polyol phosphate transport system ATPase subunit